MSQQTCKNCGEAIVNGRWQCATGEQHEVDAKTYYMDDAPSDPGPYVDGPGGERIPSYGNMAHAQTIICNLVPCKLVVGVDGIQREQPGRNVTFVRGMFQTTDPEFQYWLDKRSGLCSRERWEQVYLSPSQRLEMREHALAVESKRIETQKNDLLAMVQKQQQQKGAKGMAITEAN
jgi:hypothetical protein